MSLISRRSSQPVMLAFASVVIGGCAISSVFMTYPAQIQTIKAQIDKQQFKPALEKLAADTDSADKILYLMERGRTGEIASETATSINDYKLAMEQITINEDKAHITVSGAGATTAALLTNDNAIPYEGEAYEHIFLHHFQAMNYLFNRDLDAAAVEVRRANENQTLALREHEDEVAEAEKKQKDDLQRNNNFMNNFKGLEDAAGRVKNSFQNAYTFYMSGVVWEILGKPNDAYIDYKKALEIFPENTFLQRDVIRLAKKLAMKDDLSRLQKTIKVPAAKIGKDQGEVLVFFEHGFAPVKLEVKVGIFTSVGLQKVAFPTYAPAWNATPPLSISSDNTPLGTTQPIVYVQALASKALQERLPGLMLRQVLRVVAKNKSSKAASEKSQGFGAVMQVFNFVSERADLRSWLTLPNDAQIYRGALTKGEHTLQLNNGTASGSIQVKVTPGKRTLVRVISTGTTIHANSIVL